MKTRMKIKIMQKRHGNNEFNPNEHMHKSNVHNAYNFDNIGDRRHYKHQELNHFNRPHLPPPNRNARMPTSAPLNSSNDPRLMHSFEGDNLGQISNQIQPRCPNPSDISNMRSMPSNLQMQNTNPIPRSFQEQRFFTPSNHSSLNVSLVTNDQLFNPNIPPPIMQPPLTSHFRTPPPSHALQPRQFVPDFNQQTQVFAPLPASIPTRFPPPVHVDRQIQEQELFVKDQLEKMRESSQRSEDEKWLKDWTKRKDNMSDSVKKQSYTVSEAQEKTRHMMVLLARLQKGKHNLESMKNEDKTVWESKLKEVMFLKNELETLQSDLTNEKTVAVLKRKVERTRKKRERIKRQKVAQYERCKEELAHREEVNAEIDKKMQQVIEKQRLKKQEEDMKKEADQILGLVRKKISDANKTIQLLNSVQKLRSLRKDRLARQGILSMYERHSDSTSKSLMFETKCTDMVALLNKQLDTYKSEEEALKVILETEQEETREKEREKVQQKHRERLKQEKLAEQKMVFGNQKDPKPGDPLYPFWQYYTAAENSLEALVSIRQGWDMYLALPNTPGTSSVPDDWLIPPEPSSDIWNTALQDGVP